MKSIFAITQIMTAANLQ